MHEKPTRQGHETQGVPARCTVSPADLPPTHTSDQGERGRGTESLRPVVRCTVSATTSRSENLRGAWVELLARYRWDLFGTLTFRDATHPESALKRFRLFLSMLNRKLYGPRWYKHGKGVSYCVAMELQARGALHFHCLLADPELANLLNHSWFKLDGRWANGLNEMWNELAGFARIEPIKVSELVQGYVSKYVLKGGEIDLGGPLAQTRLEQVPAGAIAKARAAGGLCLGIHSDSVPGLPADGGSSGTGEPARLGGLSTLTSFQARSARAGGLVVVAQEHSASVGRVNHS